MTEAAEGSFRGRGVSLRWFPARAHIHPPERRAGRLTGSSRDGRPISIPNPFSRIARMFYTD